jgi:hypothetical protein
MGPTTTAATLTLQAGHHYGETGSDRGKTVASAGHAAHYARARGHNA